MNLDLSGVTHVSFQTPFGILTVPLVVENAFVRINPTDDFADVAKLFEESINRDGFYYPGQMSQYRHAPFPSSAPPTLVQGTTRPAHLFTLRPSHVLTIHNPIADEPTTDAAAFAVHLLAYLYGTRLQLAEWQFDGRIPKCGSEHHVLVTQEAAASFVERAYAEWSSLSRENRKRVTNVLYMHSRAPSYDWPWEQFLHEYMVTDALFDVQRRIGMCVPVSHEDRIREMCGRLGVWCPEDAPVAEIVRIRNDLFHTALWDDVSPGHSVMEGSYEKVFELRALNQRLIAAILAGGVRTYVETPWTDWRQQVFFE